jgi:hypothetical protein
MLTLVIKSNASLPGGRVLWHTKLECLHIGLVSMMPCRVHLLLLLLWRSAKLQTRG